MRYSRSFTCCFAGATIASLSWAIIFFLYANLNTSSNSATGRPLRFVPRHIPQEQPGSDSLPTHLPSVVINRDENRPGYGKTQDNHAVEKTYERVREGIYLDPFEASKISSETDQLEYDRGIKSHAFNEYLSKRLSFHRSITDTKDARCGPPSSYDPHLLQPVSVIMCFYNEALSVLLRSLHSIWDRTDHSLVHEIILVDDDSSIEQLKGALDHYVAQTFGAVVTIIRNSRREGLIRSRMVGARAASGKVLVFLDSHIEVNEGWLEPLVTRVVDSTVVMPIIDIIDPDTFQYKSSPLVRGAFTWSMKFSWEDIPVSALDQDYLHIRSPAMAGGLFAMRRDAFFNLGGYDTGMDIWGGENIEMSLRVWMCGGKIEIAVCSRVGHIFRRFRPYSSPNGEDTATKNTLRMVNVWLDNYKDKYHDATNKKNIVKPYGDVSDRVALRQRLSCHSFDWYLENVYNPDIRPAQGSANVKQAKVVERRSAVLSVINKGKLKLVNSDLCIQPDTSAQIESLTLLVLGSCSSADMRWYELEGGGFLISNNKCLDVVSSTPTITKCTGQGGTQQWIVQEQQGEHGLIFNPGTGRCLAVHEAAFGSQVSLTPCKEGSLFKYVKKNKKG